MSRSRWCNGSQCSSGNFLAWWLRQLLCEWIACLKCYGAILNVMYLTSMNNPRTGFIWTIFTDSNKPYYYCKWFTVKCRVGNSVVVFGWTDWLKRRETWVSIARFVAETRCCCYRNESRHRRVRSVIGEGLDGQWLSYPAGGIFRRLTSLETSP